MTSSHFSQAAAIAWCSKNAACSGFTARTPTGCGGAHAAGAVMEFYFKTGMTDVNTDPKWGNWIKPRGDKAVDSNGWVT